MSDQVIANGQPYNLIGQPLTPTGIQQLILEQFAGQTVERRDIIKAVPRIHEQRGGLRARANVQNSVKKTLRSLADAGYAKKLDTPGFWLINHDQQPVAKETLIEPVVEVEKTEISSQPEAILGKGDSAVYLYYYPTYRLYAQQQGAATWACKIGKSNGEATNRVHGQIGTALPEEPVIGLELRTSLPSQWEKAIHHILAIRGRIIEDAPGDEWFNTSPSEIIEIIQYVDPSMRGLPNGTRE